MTYIIRSACVAVHIKYESLRAAESACGASDAYVKASLLREEARLGFQLIDKRYYKQRSRSATRDGRAWAEVAVEMFNAFVALERTAASLKDRNFSRSRRVVERESVLRWRGKEHVHVEGWLGVHLVGKEGFLTVNGHILEPSLEELCGNIKRLQELEYQLQTRNSARTASVPALPMTL